MVKERLIGFIRLDGEVRGRCSEISSLQMKKAKIVWKQVDGWVGFAGIASCFEGRPYGLEQIACRSIKGVVMNVDKVVYTDPVGRCDSGRTSICVEDPAPHGTKSVLMKSILMTDKIVIGIQIEI